MDEVIGVQRDKRVVMQPFSMLRFPSRTETFLPKNLTRPNTGLAAAKTLQRAFSLAWMPALAMVTRPCSITSWMAVRSMSLI